MTDKTAKPDKKQILKLKKDHTHAGRFYPSGTLLKHLHPGPSQATLDFLKQRNII